MLELELEVLDHPTGRQQVLEFLLPFLGRAEALSGVAPRGDQLVWVLEAENLGQGGVGIVNRAVGIRLKNALDGILKEVAVLLFSLPTRGDVEVGAENPP